MFNILNSDYTFILKPHTLLRMNRTSFCLLAVYVLYDRPRPSPFVLPPVTSSLKRLFASPFAKTNL